jgi:hypothetical protein
MKLLSILFGVFCFTYGLKPTSVTDKKVVGRLVEEVESTFNCGIIKVGVVHRFIIVNNNSQETKNTIKVVCLCPEGYGKGFFKSGKLYNLTINNNLDSLKDCYIMDKFPSKKLETWILKNISSQ